MLVANQFWAQKCLDAASRRGSFAAICIHRGLTIYITAYRRSFKRRTN